MQSTESYTGSDLMHTTPGCYTLRRCCGCGVLYMNPRLMGKELDAAYPEEYISHQPYQHRNLLAHILYRIRKDRICRAVLSYYPHPAGKVLDIGCATGDFLESMRWYGWDAYGIEPSSRAAAYAREIRHLDVFTGTLEEAPYEDGSFDIVTLWHVLEHVPDPVGTLRRIRRLLKPDGLLVFAIPNSESYEASLFRGAWSGLDIPRHLFVFSPTSVETALKRSGFETIHARGLFGSYSYAMLSLLFLIRKLTGNHKLVHTARQIVLNRIATVTGTILFAPLATYLSRTKRSAILMYYARVDKK